MKTAHYIVNPYTGDLQTLPEWKEYVESNSEWTKVTDALCICIIPEDGTPFVFPKKDLGRMSWEDAMQAASKAVIPLPKQFLEKFSTGLELSLPTRKQGIDIGDCNYALPKDEQPEIHLDDTLEAIGGQPFSGTYFWSSSRYNANTAWCFYGGNGAAYLSYFYSACRALPLVLCPGAKRP
ncbi:MAG: hypothetical protein IKS71_04355 [Bacteroidales bacterium]|nr:hypothetical protein [Bacteroidales bacterium]